MKSTSNLKDTLTTITGILIALSGTVAILAKSGVAIPENINTLAISIGVIALGIQGYLTGKNPNGTTKTAEQVVAQNTTIATPEGNIPVVK